MAVYVDSLINWGWRLGPSCHLVADTPEELRSFAARLGMRRAWEQTHGGLLHYDLTERRRRRAIALGAIELDRSAFVARMRVARRGDGL